LVKLLPVLTRLDVTALLNKGMIKFTPISCPVRAADDYRVEYIHEAEGIDCITPLEMFYGVTNGFQAMSTNVRCHAYGCRSIDYFEKTKSRIEEGITEQLNRVRQNIDGHV
jgi:hypothetical protein